MTVRFANNFNAALAASISSAATTISLPAGYGSLLATKLGAPLGTDHIYGTLVNSANDIEIVKITAVTGDNLTVLRGLDNTSARAWLAGDVLSLRACAASLSEAINLPTDLAHSGINLDITELRGLTTPLSVAQGGTGAGSFADAGLATTTDMVAADAVVLASAIAAVPAALNATGAAPVYGCRAYGYVSGGTLVSGQNCTVSGNNITLLSPPADTNYTVIASCRTDSGWNYSIQYQVGNNAQFTVYMGYEDVNQHNNVPYSFAVFW